MSSRIPELEGEIRELVNAPRRHSELCDNRCGFSQMCSALDVLGDTELALDCFLENASEVRDTSALYLDTYGVLQALVLQQDATAHLAESLGLTFKKDDTLRDIREVRNNAVGHPTRRGHAPGTAFNHVSRVTLSSSGFDLLTFDALGVMRQQHVSMPELICAQRSILEGRLESLVEAERNRENAHRQRFAGELLAALLDKEMGYWIGKVFEQIEGAPGLSLGSSGLDLIGKRLDCLHEKLVLRGEARAIPEVIQDDLDPARHALMRLREFFQEGERPQLCKADALAFASDLDSRIRNLCNLMSEIDRTYSESV